MPRAKVLGTVLVLGLLAGCSGGGSGSSSGGGGDRTGLRAALARVADTAETRREVAYDDTAALVKLAGRGWNSNSAYGQLRGFGASSLVAFEQLLAENPGINLLDADYTVVAGQPPAQIGLVAGGQHQDKVNGMTRRGWKRQGDHLVAPPFSAADMDHPENGELALNMATVKAGGSDMAYGGTGAKLDWVTSPGKQTLATDRAIGALADCLGDVVAAQVVSSYTASGAKPDLVAAGIRRPHGNSDTPHAVVCVSWPSASAADQYASAVRTALASGKSMRTLEPYADTLKHPTVRNVGGGTHVVGWGADTPGRAMLVFQMISEMDLPALPSCRVSLGSSRC
ncbi:MAG: hypothetical protein ACJ73S_02260 [Mycobacteriales bacterium]